MTGTGDCYEAEGELEMLEQEMTRQGVTETRTEREMDVETRQWTNEATTTANRWTSLVEG